MIEVFKPGTIVHLSPDGDVKGMITAVSIGPNDSTQYEVVWWASGNRNVAWMGEMEFSTRYDKYSVGFKT